VNGDRQRFGAFVPKLAQTQVKPVRAAPAPTESRRRPRTARESATLATV
jgi:hypothetical protein